MQNQPPFELGQVLATPGALAALEDARQSPLTFLVRHHAGDWGDVDAEDASLNNKSLQAGSRLLSSYRLNSGARIWIITEAVNGDGHREATTILLPKEY